MSDDAPAARRGRRRVRETGPSLPKQPPFRQPRHTYPPLAAVSEDQLESIHLASLRVLEEIGMDFLDADARALLADKGADVDGERVRFGPELVMELIATAPSHFTLHARNPAHDLVIGDGMIANTAVSSPPNVADLAGGRRTGNLEDFRKLIKLGHMLTSVHMWGGYPVEPVDVHPSVRHLRALRETLVLSDKTVYAYSLGRQMNRDSLEMVRIARQVDDDALDDEPSLMSVVNSSSPLRLDTPMLRGIMEFSSRNQIIVITPFTLAGAMAPVTLAGALVEQNAEALAGVAMTQAVRPGAPAVYGGFTSNVDMQSGAPAFGTPEYMKTALVGGQLARRYGLPYRSSNVSTSNAVDTQAGYESVFALWGAILGGANIVYHAAGWMEGGLQASFEKMVVDADLLHMVSVWLDPLIVDDASLAIDAIREVGPGGHFFGSAHTLERYRDAFYKPLVSDWRNYEAWEEAGSPETAERAATLAAALIAAHEPPPLAATDELDEFVDRRIAEGGVATDY